MHSKPMRRLIACHGRFEFLSLRLCVDAWRKYFVFLRSSVELTFLQFINAFMTWNWCFSLSFIFSINTKKLFMTHSWEWGDEGDSFECVNVFDQRDLQLFIWSEECQLDNEKSVLECQAKRRAPSKGRIKRRKSLTFISSSVAVVTAMSSRAI